jgi:hypothetical protein
MPLAITEQALAKAAAFVAAAGKPQQASAAATSGG